MIDKETKVREYLKSLDNVTLADSFLVLYDLGTTPISTIIEKIYSLYYDVSRLGQLVNSGFESKNGEKVPTTPTTQGIVIKDYFLKKAALNKILENRDVLEMFSEYADELANKEQRHNALG